MKSSLWISLLAILAMACDPPSAATLTPASSLAQAQTFVAPQPSAHSGRIHDFDALHYRVSLAVDPQAKLYEGEVSLRFRAMIPGFRTLSLDCGDNEIRQVRLGETILAKEKEGESLRIGLVQPLARGEEAEVRISFAGVPSRGVYFREPGQVYTQGQCEDMRYVFPCYDFPDDKATSELLLSVPEKYKTIAAGSLFASSPAAKPGWRQDHWRMDTPHSSYLFTFAVGEFVEVREQWNDIPVSYFGEPGDEEKLRLAFGKTPQAMQFFSDYIGVAYPYSKYAQVCVRDFQFGGMENISATTQTRLTLHEASSEPLANSDGLMAHELAHQWWGDLLTCADWSQIWLNEGFATYFEALFRESVLGREEFLLAMQGQQEAAIEAERKESRPIVYDRYIDPLDLFFSGHVYPGGSSRLHLLRYWLGEDRFRAGISLYAKRHREKNVTSEDFRRAMEDASGEKLETFFAQWVYGKGFPEFRVRWEWDEASSCMMLRVEQTQKEAPFVVPLDVAFTISEQPPEKITRRLWMRDRAMTFVLPLSAPPLLSRFDFGGHVPKTLDEEKSAEQWLYQLRRDEDPVGRLEAARALENLLRPETKPALDTALRRRILEILQSRFEEESRPRIREEILAGLRHEISESVRDFLLGKIGEPEARARKKVLWALGFFSEDVRVAEAMRKQFVAESNAYVAAQVPEALARKRGSKTGEFLLEAIEKDSDGDVIRAAAIAALAEIDHPQAAMLALRFARPGHSQAARSAALRALAKRGKGKKEAIDLFLATLEDANASLRSVAVEALGEAGSSAQLPSLIARHAKEPFPPVRRAIEKAIAKHQAKHWGRSLDY